MRIWVRFLMAVAGLSLAGACSSYPVADVVLKNGEIYTMEEDRPWAKAIAVSGNRILAVLDGEEQAVKYVGPGTRVIDLKGAFAVPGFIDAHTHFNSAGSLVNGVNLLTVADNEGLRKEISRVVGIVGEGEWITGGLWGAYEQWALGAASSGDRKLGAGSERHRRSYSRESMLSEQLRQQIVPGQFGGVESGRTRACTAAGHEAEQEGDAYRPDQPGIAGHQDDPAGCKTQIGSPPAR